MFPLFRAQFLLDQQQLSLLTGLNVIAFGLAKMSIVPLFNIFGRRPITILCGVLVILTNVWQAFVTTQRSFLAARACNGIVAATSGAIMVQAVGDMFSLRGLGFSVRSIAYSNNICAKGFEDGDVFHAVLFKHFPRPNHVQKHLC